MRNSINNPPTALSTAVAAWNNKARESSAPVLRHIFATIRNLQRLRSAIRHYGEIDPATLGEDFRGPVDGGEPVKSLRDLCSRLDRFEESLARLSEQALDASRQGEALIKDYLSLPLRGPAVAVVPDEDFQLHLSNWAEDGIERRRETDMRALDRLIAAQKAEIDALNQQLADAEAWVSPRAEAAQAELPRSFGQIELQSVEEFVLNSPIASIPVNASYYQRILEAASSPEGHKVPMGRILTSAGVVSDRQLQSALEYQREGRKQALGSLLVDLGYTTEDAIAQALAAQLGLRYVVLDKELHDPAALSAVPMHIARRHACFPIHFNGPALCVAMANPLDLIALEDLRIASNRHIRPCVAARSEIASYIARHYG